MTKSLYSLSFKWQHLMFNTPYYISNFNKSHLAVALYLNRLLLLF